MKNTESREQKELRLEDGKLYKDREGNILAIEEYSYSETYPFKSECGVRYTANGKYFSCGEYSERDLVEEVSHFSSAGFSHLLESQTNPKDLVGIKKPPMSFIPPALLVHAAMAFKNGAEKYGAYNWRTKKVQAMIYIDAILRHAMAYLDGEEVASDSKVHHLAHIAACSGILLDASESGNLIDNRPPKGNSPSLIERFTEC